MRPPIQVAEGDDISSFASVDEAESYLEPIDVRNNEFVVTDADGRLLSAVVMKRKQSFFGLFTYSIEVVKIVERPLPA